MENQSPTVRFLVQLHKIDKRYLTLRDVLALYAIMGTPAMSGIDLAKMLGFGHRSAVNSNITRLLRQGLIEDRRKNEHKGEVNVLYATDAGRAFWDEIKPQG